jgi:hypothetical protein
VHASTVEPTLKPPLSPRNPVSWFSRYDFPERCFPEKTTVAPRRRRALHPAPIVPHQHLTQCFAHSGRSQVQHRKVVTKWDCWYLPAIATTATGLVIPLRNDSTSPPILNFVASSSSGKMRGNDRGCSAAAIIETLAGNKHGSCKETRLQQTVTFHHVRDRRPRITVFVSLGRGGGTPAGRM